MARNTPQDKKVLLVGLSGSTGRNVAILLQELHFILSTQKKGTWSDTYEGWRTQHFPFWSAITVKRAFLKAEEMGLVNSEQSRRGKAYSINYDALVSVERQGVRLLVTGDKPIKFSAFAAANMKAHKSLTLNDAFLLFEIVYWMGVEEKKYRGYKQSNVHAGRYWDTKTVEQLANALLVSGSTVKNSIKRLREAGLLHTRRTETGAYAFSVDVNNVAELESTIKVPTPPEQTGGHRYTSFHERPFTLAGNDIAYLKTLYANFIDPELLNLDEDYGIPILRDIVQRIGKRGLVDFLRDTECRELLKSEGMEGLARYFGLKGYDWDIERYGAETVGSSLVALSS